MKKFWYICKKNQSELKKYVHSELIKKFGKEEVIVGDGYVYAKGDIPVLLTAHLDTVHNVTCRRYEIIKANGKHIIKSKEGIGGDDRCGVYIILQILERGLKPSILFCEDEEIGGVGSEKFCVSEYINELSELRYLIELDRANAKDAVFYSCDNPDFTKYITETTAYKKANGSFSDIRNLSPFCGVASVNLSCGYYNAHTTKEYVVFEEMCHTIDVVEKLLKDKITTQFEYIEEKKSYFDNWYNYHSIMGVEVTYIDASGNAVTDFAYGDSEEEALLSFFLEHPYTCYADVLDYNLF